MGKGNFARLGISPSAYECHVRNGVVRASERSAADECTVFGKFAGHTVYFGGFQRFHQGKGRQNGRYPFGEHGFACTGWAN